MTSSSVGCEAVIYRKQFYGRAGDVRSRNCVLFSRNICGNFFLDKCEVSARIKVPDGLRICIEVYV